MALPMIGDDPGGGETGGGGGGGFSPGTLVLQADFYKPDNASLVKVLAYVGVNHPDDLQFFAYVMCGGQLHQQSPNNMPLDNKGSRGAMTATVPAYIYGLPTGQHTAALYVRNRDPDGQLTVLAGAALEINIVKPAGV